MVKSYIYAGDKVDDIFGDIITGPREKYDYTFGLKSGQEIEYIMELSPTELMMHLYKHKRLFIMAKDSILWMKRKDIQYIEGQKVEEEKEEAIT